MNGLPTPADDSPAVIGVKTMANSDGQILVEWKPREPAAVWEYGLRKAATIYDEAAYALALFDAGMRAQAAKTAAEAVPQSEPIPADDPRVEPVARAISRLASAELVGEMCDDKSPIDIGVNARRADPRTEAVAKKRAEQAGERYVVDPGWWLDCAAEILAAADAVDPWRGAAPYPCTVLGPRKTRESQGQDTATRKENEGA